MGGRLGWPQPRSTPGQYKEAMMARERAMMRARAKKTQRKIIPPDKFNQAKARGVVGGKERHGIGDVLRRAHAPHRD